MGAAGDPRHGVTVKDFRHDARPGRAGSTHSAGHARGRRTVGRLLARGSTGRGGQRLSGQGPWPPLDRRRSSVGAAAGASPVARDRERAPVAPGAGRLVAACTGAGPLAARARGRTSPERGRGPPAVGVPVPARRRGASRGGCPAPDALWLRAQRSPEQRACARTTPGGAPLRTCVGGGRTAAVPWGRRGPHECVARSAAHAPPGPPPRPRLPPGTVPWGPPSDTPSAACAGHPRPTHPAPRPRGSPSSARPPDQP